IVLCERTSIEPFQGAYLYLFHFSESVFLFHFLDSEVADDIGMRQADQPWPVSHRDIRNGGIPAGLPDLKRQRNIQGLIQGFVDPCQSSLADQVSLGIVFISGKE